jgi:hypothetical protein
MKKQFIYTLVALIILTSISALVAQSSISQRGVVILVLSAIKFLLVAFQFMELYKANTFWKVLLSLYLFIFVLIIGIAL